MLQLSLSLSTLLKLHRSSICTHDFEASERFRSSIATTICSVSFSLSLSLDLDLLSSIFSNFEGLRDSVISERFRFRSSIATTICTGDFDFTKKLRSEL